MRIVIVDDNKVELSEVQKIVSAIPDAEIMSCFFNGGDAFAYIQNHSVDIVLSDIQMPVMDGIELITAIRRENIDAEVIFLSCYDDFRYVKDALRNNAFNYILKPVVAAELIHSVENAWQKIVKRRNITSIRKQMSEEMDVLRPLMLDAFFRRQLFSPNVYAAKQQEMKSLRIDWGWTHKTVIRARVMVEKREDAEQDILDYPGGALSCFRTEIEALSNGKRRFYSVGLSDEEGSVVALSVDDTIAYDEILSDFKFYLMERFGLYVAFGISMTSETENLYNLNKQAKRALEYTFNSHVNYVIRYEDIGNELENEVDVSSVTKEVRQIILVGDKHLIDPFIQNCFGENQYFNKEYAKNTAYCIAYSVEMALLEYGKSLDEELGHHLWKKLHRIDNIVNLKVWLYNILGVAVELVHAEKSGSEEQDNHRRLVEDIKEIIQKEYGDKLTIAQIASRLGYSSRYLSMIFMKKENCSILDYLTEWRMKKAQEFLREKDAKIYLVAERVGYQRKSYFYDVFRTYTGMSPSDYQKAAGSAK